MRQHRSLRLLAASFVLSSIFSFGKPSPVPAAPPSEVQLDLTTFQGDASVVLPGTIGFLAVIGSTTFAIDVVATGNVTDITWSAVAPASSLTLEKNLHGILSVQGTLNAVAILGNILEANTIEITAPVPTVFINGNTAQPIIISADVGELQIAGNVNNPITINGPATVGAIIVEGNLNDDITVGSGATVNTIFIAGNLTAGADIVVEDGGFVGVVLVGGQYLGESEVPPQQGDPACVTNQAPAASAVASPPSPSVGTVVALDAAASTDPDVGDTITFKWSVVSAPEPVVFNPDDISPVVTFTPGTAGTYDLRLTATDSCGFLDTEVLSVTASSIVVTYTSVEVGDPRETGGTHVAMYGNIIVVGGSGLSPNRGYFDISAGTFTDLHETMGSELDEPTIWGTRILDEDRVFDVSTAQLTILPQDNASDIWSDIVAYPHLIKGDTVGFYDLLNASLTLSAFEGFAARAWGDTIMYTTLDFHIALFSMASGQSTVLSTLGVTTDSVSGNRRFIWGDQAVFLGADEWFTQTDLNGDGKVTVLVANLDLATNAVRSLDVGTPLGIHGQRVLFFNDLAPLWGDPPDYTLKIYDLQTNQITDLGIPVGTAAIFGNTAAFATWEQWLGIDQTGDGDFDDWVLGFVQF